MDAAGFLVLVKNFTNLTREESDLVRDLSRQYPYSQVLHHLQSRSAQDRNEQNQSSLLHTSAIYATDRSILKWLMVTPRRERIQRPDLPPAVTTPPREIETVKIIEPAPPALPERVLKPNSEETLSGDALRTDLYA
jgi:hypothetical protein